MFDYAHVMKRGVCRLPICGRDGDRLVDRLADRNLPSVLVVEFENYGIPVVFPNNEFDDEGMCWLVGWLVGWLS